MLLWYAAGAWIAGVPAAAAPRFAAFVSWSVPDVFLTWNVASTMTSWNVADTFITKDTY